MKRILLLVALVGLLAGCGFTSTGRTTDGRIIAVGAESQYADVIRQIGGDYVDVTAILSNPAADPHTFEASPSIARAVAGAGLVVQNGLGYDEFVNQLEQASESNVRRVIDVQQLLGKSDDTANPHLWYDPATMPKVADAVARELSALDPAHRADFAANARAFRVAQRNWTDALAQLRHDHPRAAVATTEPVADYLINAAGLDNRTPWAFQSAVMKGADPSPQAVAELQTLFKKRQVKVFIYNVQVTDSLTESFADVAKKQGIPVVGVYETLPEGFTYQAWMLAQTRAIQTALATGKSVSW